MLHYRDKRVKGLFKLKTFSFLLFCFTYCFLVHSACMGAEETPHGTDSPKIIKSLSRERLSKSVSFDSHSSDSSNSPTSSHQSLSSGNSSPIPKKSTRGSIDSQSNENHPTTSHRDKSCNKKRNRLTRSFSSNKIKEKFIKSDQKSFSITENEEKKLSLSDLLTETTTVLQEVNEKKEIAGEILSLFVDERAIFAALIDLDGAPFEKLEGTYPHTIITPLRELIFHKFPGRVENLKLRLTEYDQQMKFISTAIINLTIKQVTDYCLLKKFLPSDIVNRCMLFQYWVNNSELAYLQGLKLKLNPLKEGGGFPWSLSNAHQFASALYLRDAATFEAINPGDILFHLTDKDHASKKAIITLTDNYKTTVDAWTSLIINEKDEKNQKTLIKNFAYLERYLHKMHNYHGASQVDACFTGISNLWAGNPALNPSNIDSYWTSVNEDMTHKHNYRVYREQLAQSQNDPAYLPNFMVIVHDLAVLLESSFSEEPDKVLPGLAIALEPLLKLKMITPMNYLSSLMKQETENSFLKPPYNLSKIDESSLK